MSTVNHQEDLRKILEPYGGNLRYRELHTPPNYTDHFLIDDLDDFISRRVNEEVEAFAERVKSRAEDFEVADSIDGGGIRAVLVDDIDHVLAEFKSKQGEARE
jgi:hypothetical protein